jgi:predicted RNA-binding Zn-ribbon protein involved in translation (DUF1610 family)
MPDSEFWAEVRSRRNHFFLWWIGWPLGGIPIVLIYTVAVEKQSPFPFMIGMMFAWYGVWLIFVRRLKSLLCPNCGQPAIAHAYFFMRHAKCQHCGLQYGSTLPTVEP